MYVRSTAGSRIMGLVPSSVLIFMQELSPMLQEAPQVQKVRHRIFDLSA